MIRYDYLLMGCFLCGLVFLNFDEILVVVVDCLFNNFFFCVIVIYIYCDIFLLIWFQFLKIVLLMYVFMFLLIVLFWFMCGINRVLDFIFCLLCLIKFIFLVFLFINLILKFFYIFLIVNLVDVVFCFLLLDNLVFVGDIWFQFQVVFCGNIGYIIDFMILLLNVMFDFFGKFFLFFQVCW